MKINELLEQVDRLREMYGESDAALSRRIGLSPYIIQNWRKRARGGEGDMGANNQSVEALKEAMRKSEFPLTENSGSTAYQFAEGEVATWVPKTEQQGLTLMEALAPNTKQPATFMLKSDLHSLAYKAGDVLIVDLNQPAETGNTVIATIADLEIGSATTVVRRYMHPYLIPEGTNRKPDLVDNERVVVMGPVVAAFRSDDQ